MTDRISGARAHVLVQEVLAQQFAGQGFTGAARSSGQYAYPQNLSAVIEKYDTAGRRHSIIVGGPDGFAEDYALTEDSWRNVIQGAARAVQEGIEKSIKAQTASEPSEAAGGSSDPSEAPAPAERPAEGQDGVLA